MNMLRASVVHLISVLVVATTGRGDVFETHNTGTWSNANNWSQNGSYPAGRVPASGDVVYIDHTFTCDVNATANYVEVAFGKTLSIDSSKSLTISNVNPSAVILGSVAVYGTLTVDYNASVTGSVVVDGGTLNTPSASLFAMTVSGSGSLTMQGASPTVTLNTPGALRLTDAASYVLVAPSNGIAWVTGSGSLAGQHGSAQIRINGGAFLAWYATLQGRLIIQKNGGSSGTPIFYNDGVVNADSASGTMLFDYSVDLLDDTIGQWRSDNGGTLQFDATASSGLVGDVVAGAAIVFNNSVTTDGKASLLEGGQIVANDGATFTYFGIGSDPCNHLPATSIIGVSAVSCP